MGLEDITVVHAIPGRIRLKVAEVRHNPALAAEIQGRLSTVQGIQKVEANPRTGSVLVLYQGQEMLSLTFLRALAEPLALSVSEVEGRVVEAWLSLSVEGSSSMPSLASGIAGFFRTLNTGVEQTTGGSADLKLLLPLALFVLGIRGLLGSEQVGFPAWYDLLWFSFGTFFMLHPRLDEGRP